MSPAVSPMNDNDHSLGRTDPDTQRVFVRIIAARPGAPWDQSRQAALEARLGAPARLTEIVYRVRRLDGWRPGEPARFAAVYAHAEDARDGLVATPVVDGRQITVDFSPPARQAERLRAPAIALTAAAIVGCLLWGLGHLVAERRSALSDMLLATEQIGSQQAREASEILAAKRQYRELEGEDLHGRLMSDLLSDVAWVARSKAPLARIQVLHWDHGFMAVEVEGADPPFQSGDRPLEKAKKPVRPGVWLWGVGSIEPWQSLAGAGRPANASGHR